ncbi:MAG: excinuclease ABC subunit UvrC [Oscillospiraceae bacterium]|jgi:excinuclease ABC subunit C|nr:excinuclease ABC subunit UvrC [Oscillospiraceae bacterium]
MTHDELREKALSLPLRPGVYIMMDKLGDVIYVGKAVALKNRVSSYFHGAHNAKTELMVSKIFTFDTIVAGSEFEALVLENMLIKHHLPKYNIDLRDDKGHPYIRVDTRSEYPTFRVVGKKQNDGAKYLGPYASRGAAFSAIRAVSRALGLPDCTRKFPRDVGKERPCLNHHMGFCRGWCQAGVSAEDYREQISSALKIFDGKADALLSVLTEEMTGLAKEMKFEAAVKVRDEMRAVTELTKRQFVVAASNADLDAIGFYRGSAKSCFVALHYIGGRLLGKDYELFETPLEEDGEAISAVLRLYYARRDAYPKTILLQLLPPDAEDLERLFSESAETRVELLSPRRGDKRRLVENACENAREEAERAVTYEEKTRRTIEWLARAMDFAEPPRRMEAYDISNTGGDDIVASMTVFENGRPRKRDYKRFKMKTVDTPDDYKSMEETITRRAKRFLDGDESFVPLPDVFLIDGGQGHAAVARRALTDLGIDVPVFGMVKDDRHRTRALVTPDGRELGIAANPAAFALIGTIQEETHRFAVEFHHALHGKRVRKSKLEQISGVGAVRRAALLKHFGTLAAVRAATVPQLCAVLPKNAAEAVYEYFRKAENGGEKADGFTEN